MSAHRPHTILAHPPVSPAALRDPQELDGRAITVNNARQRVAYNNNGGGGGDGGGGGGGGDGGGME
jgi:hypothetical protein